MDMSNSAATQCSAYTQNVLPLLYEISHALEALQIHGETRTIDLRALPLAPGEEEEIESLLGTGEVSAQLDALGTSHIKETRFPGVWLITHYNTEQELIAKFIEITRMPSILQTQPDDIADSRQILAVLLTDYQTEV